MLPDEFRREIRTVPTNGGRVIVLPDFYGDLAPTQLTTEGRHIDTISKGGIDIVVRSPDVKLFYLEEPPINVPDGSNQLYDKSAAFGSDERFGAGIGKLPLTHLTLEVMVEAFIVRAIDLETNAEKRDSISAFYPYATYHVFGNELRGRLLASKEVAPAIALEIKTADNYYHSKGHEVRRCLYCDMAETEVKNMRDGGEHRVILAREHFVSMQPYAARDQHTIHIYPRRQYHAPRFTKMTEEQKTILAEMMYDAVMRILTRRPNRYFSLVHMSLHSAPYQHNGGNAAQTINPLEKLFDFHVEISPGQIPPYGASFDIPDSKWTVVPGRPRDTAKSLREVSYHQPYPLLPIHSLH